MLKEICTFILFLIIVFCPCLTYSQVFYESSSRNDAYWENYPVMAEGDTIYVSIDGYDLSGDGSLGLPYRTIQHAMNVASTGSIIVVNSGTYEENIDFKGKDLVIASLNGPDETTIQAVLASGETYAGPCVTFAGGESRGAVLDGFTVTGSGQAGILCSGASPTIINNIIRNNTSHDFFLGAGISISGSDGALIKGNLLHDNQADRHGSAIHVMNGGADTICYNIARDNLGLFAFRCVSSNSVIYNNTIYYADFYGINIQTSGHVTIYNNIVYGATLYAFSSDDENYVDAGYNCFWECPSGGYRNIDPGEGAINADPLFIDPVAGNFNLRDGSLCLDAGNPESFFNDYDGSRNDIGALPYVNYPPLAMELGFGSFEVNGVVIDPYPVIEWTYFDTTLSEQYACELEIGTDNDWSSAEIWSTGELIQSESVVLYDGTALENEHSYFLRVRLRNDDHWGGWVEKEFHVLLTDDIVVPTMFPAIQDAINYAESGDRILVLPGTYQENLDFSGKSLVVISSEGALETFLQPGDDTYPSIKMNNGENSDTRLEGFTIENGGTVSSIIIGSDAQPVITRNIIRRNIPEGITNSAAIWCSGTALIKFNLFYENGGDGSISAVGAAQVINNTFVNNHAGVYSDGTATVYNNIFVGNTDFGVIGAARTDYNNIWNNGPGSQHGPNNISADPMFINPDEYDFHLSTSSPCIDAGFPSEIYNDIDGTRNDLGAYPIEPMQPFAWQIEFGPESVDHYIKSQSPEFYWTYVDTPLTVQTHYQLQLGLDNDWTEVEVWDSEPVASSEPVCVYSAEPLVDNTIYFARLRLSNGGAWGDWIYFWFEIAVPNAVYVPLDYGTIQAAINSVHEYDSILVRPGIYNQNVDFIGKNIVLISTDGPEVTTIQAVDEGNNSPDKADIIEKGHCVSFDHGETREAVLSGFTLTGSETGSIRCENSSPTIVNNIIRANISYRMNHASAITLLNSQGALVKNNHIFTNFSGSISSAIYVYEGIDDTICYNTLYDNTGGSGIYFRSSNGVAYNNTIYDVATSGMNFEDSEVDVRNNIIYRADGYGLNAWGSSDITSDYNCFFACLTDEYNNVDPGDGDIIANPLFVDRTSFDFNLQKDSPCIDAGDPDPVHIDSDGTRNDMGSIPYIRQLPYPMDFNFGHEAMDHIVFTETPVFKWKYFDTTDVPQYQYQIQIDTDSLWNDIEVWDTGPIVSSDEQVIYSGDPLSNSIVYYIRTRVGRADIWGDWNNSWFAYVNHEGISVPGDYATMNEAIDASNYSDTVWVWPGSYTEDVRLNGKYTILKSTHGPKHTILRPASENLATVGLASVHGYHDIISGFKIIGGSLQPFAVVIAPGCSPTIENNIFWHNMPGNAPGHPVIMANGPAIIKNNLFYENYGSHSIWAKSSPTIVNNTIVNNAGGIFSENFETICLNNIVVENKGVGISGDYSINAYNNVWANGSDNEPGTYGISQNPMFMDPEIIDYRLQDSSPCINAGHPGEEYNDPDGTRNDMGAYPTRVQPPYATHINFGPNASGSIVETLVPEIHWTYFDTSATTQIQYHI